MAVLLTIYERVDSGVANHRTTFVIKPMQIYTKLDGNTENMFFNFFIKFCDKKGTTYIL